MNSKRIFFYSVFSVISFLQVNFAVAQPPAGGIDVNVIQAPNVINAIDNLIAGYGHSKAATDQLYPRRPDDDPIKTLSKVFTVVFPEKVISVVAPNKDPITEINNQPYPQDLTSQALYDMLTTINPAQTTNWMLTKVPVPEYAHACEKPVFSNGQYTCPDASPTNLNMDNLVRPTQYDEGQQTTAKNLLRFITGLASPPTAINFGKLSPKDREVAMQNTKVQQYLATLRTLTAVSSVGISNLYYLYAERVPIKMDNPNPNDTNQKQIEKSPLQMEQEMATRRLRDASWFAKMEAASPATIQREMLYLLAEIRFELFQNRMVNERLLATQSVIQVQNASATPQAMQLPQQFNEIVGAPPFAPAPPK
jgi:hypothetical protein